MGNLWRFPYLAAKDGGGLFLLVYLALVLTFGFTLLTSDIAIGRRTKKSAIGAYTRCTPVAFSGHPDLLVPVLIMTYYAVIGGWITKYAVSYLTGQAAAAAQDNLFYQLYLLAGIALWCLPYCSWGSPPSSFTTRRAGWH